MSGDSHTLLRGEYYICLVGGQLNYFDLTFCREEIVQACSLQRDYFEMAVNGSEKARECCNLVVLAMYVFIPPSRGLEIRTLQIERDWKNFTPEKSKGKNLVLLQESSQVTLHFDNYKTHKHYGHEQIFLKVRKGQMKNSI